MNKVTTILPSLGRLLAKNRNLLQIHSRNITLTKSLSHNVDSDSKQTITRQMSATLTVNITTDNEKKTSYIDSTPNTSGREGKLVKATTTSDKACVLCRLNLPKLEYTDVMILSQFLEKDGSLLTYHETKLCSKQYLLVKSLLKKAQRCNLVPRPADYLVPGPWHDLNTYIEIDRKRDQPMKVIKKEYWKI